MSRSPVYSIETPYAGAEWVRRSIRSQISPLGEVVADILGAAFLGIYHLDYGALRRVEWGNPQVVRVTLRQALATFDFAELTWLVVLCHDACIRLQVEGVGPRYIRLSFWARHGREGDVDRCHPTIERAVALAREKVGRAVPIEGASNPDRTLCRWCVEDTHGECAGTGVECDCACAEPHAKVRNGGAAAEAQEAGNA